MNIKIYLKLFEKKYILKLLHSITYYIGDINKTNLLIRIQNLKKK
jgi:hypothetical protein